MHNQKLVQSNHLAGLFTLSLRLVVGWTYFSAFWRRLVLTNKLDPDAVGYIGEKFNNFLPNALGIHPIIEYLVRNPHPLWWAMVIFTMIEGVVGLCLMFGLFTRLMSFGVLGLAMGILLGSGWLGTTCLDEWQIGILGIAAGFTLFLSGSGKYSMDYLLIKRRSKITLGRWFRWTGSGDLPVEWNVLHRVAFSGSMAILLIALFTNQYFHGGVWGTLHNRSVIPKIEIAHGQLSANSLSFQVSRVEGVDVYGSFLIGIELTDTDGQDILQLDGADLSAFPTQNIANVYVAKVKPGKHSLIIPLGAKATITIKDGRLSALPAGKYKITLTDISGITWSELIKI